MNDISGAGWQVMFGSCLDRLPELADNSIDAVVTDPPYELGFKGKSWDSSGIAFNQQVWAECLRVLKPGGHLLAFSGSRTYHRMTIAIEDAGFEIRDMIAWISNKTFPKSLDISKAIDKGTGENRQRQLRFTEWMRSTGITAQQINDATGTQMGYHYTTHPTQPAIATADLFDKLRPLLPEVPEYIERLVAERTGIEWTAYKNREVIGERKQRGSQSGVVAFNRADSETEIITAPATDAAKQWQGWGTALKPAFEPVVVARKPLVGTVAANVLEWGTGGLNIDGTRIATTDRFGGGAKGASGFAAGYESDGWTPGNANGRWPSNVILDPFTAELLDEQSGDGVSRFFYCARASKRDRDEGLAEINKHPTVKPTKLMRYLVKLVTSPGGTVLDPFTGSGSTGKAAILEGFEFIGCELTEDYLPIIEGRLLHATDTVIERGKADDEKLF